MDTMQQRLSITAAVTVLLICLIILNMRPDNALVILLVHCLGAFLVYLILTLLRVKRVIATTFSIFIGIASILFVFNMLSLINFALLCAIGLTGFVYSHTK